MLDWNEPWKSAINAYTLCPIWQKTVDPLLHRSLKPIELKLLDEQGMVNYIKGKQKTANSSACSASSQTSYTCIKDVVVLQHFLYAWWLGWRSWLSPKYRIIWLKVTLSFWIFVVVRAGRISVFVVWLLKNLCRKAGWDLQTCLSFTTRDFDVKCWIGNGGRSTWWNITCATFLVCPLPSCEN